MAKPREQEQIEASGDVPASYVIKRSAASVPRKSNGTSSIDSIDDVIIGCLRVDGRMSNRDLAAEAGVSEATIRARIRRLEESETMRVVAVVDLAAAGISLVAPIGIEVKGRTAAEVGDDLAKIDRVMSVTVTIGTQDLEVQLVARDLEEMGALFDTISRVPGVERVNRGLAIEVLKYESQWVPFS